jgi:hypothetical protein
LLDCSSYCPQLRELNIEEELVSHTGAERQHRAMVKLRDLLRPIEDERVLG